MLLSAISPTPKPRQAPLVLLVEDHVDTRQMYAEFLGTMFDVVQAGTGAEALVALHERVVDVLVTDLSLPGMDGLELITQVRSDPQTSRMPVVCVSGYGGFVHEERAREAGCNRVLQKPCLPDVLADIIQDILRERPNRSEA